MEGTNPGVTMFYHFFFQIKSLKNSNKELLITILSIKTLILTLKKVGRA